MPKKMKETRRTQGEGSYYNEGDTFCWKIRVEGRAVVRKAPTMKALKLKVREALREIEERGAVLAKIDRDMSVAAYLNSWLETMVKPNRAAKTYRQYEQLTRLYMIPALGSMRLQDLKAMHVQTMLNGLKGRGLSSQTITLTRSALRRALTLAIRQKLILTNPVDATEPVKLVHRERRALDLYGANRLMTVLRADKSRYAPILQFILATGLRITEALGVTWEDVDPRAKPKPTVHVRRRLEWRDDGTWVLMPPKTAKSIRLIPLNDDALAAMKAQMSILAGDLERLEEKASEATKRGLMFTTDVLTPMGERNVQRALDALLKKADLPHFSLHDLRRTFGSLLASQGCPINVLQNLMGHENSQTTLRHYTMAYGKDMASAVDFLDRPSLPPGQTEA